MLQFSSSDGMFCVPVCDHCFLPWHWWPLRRAYFSFLCILHSCIHTFWKDLFLSLFFNLDTHNSLNNLLHERCSSPLNILMSLHWILSSTSTSLLYWELINKNLDICGLIVLLSLRKVDGKIINTKMLHCLEIYVYK